MTGKYIQISSIKVSHFFGSFMPGNKKATLFGHFKNLERKDFSKEFYSSLHVNYTIALRI